jgi:hypothetical protein
MEPTAVVGDRCAGTVLEEHAQVFDVIDTRAIGNVPQGEPGADTAASLHSDDTSEMPLTGLSEVSVYPCMKGRLYDMAEKKLPQLCDRTRTKW